MDGGFGFSALLGAAGLSGAWGGAALLQGADGSGAAALPDADAEDTLTDGLSVYGGSLAGAAGPADGLSESELVALPPGDPALLAELQRMAPIGVGWHSSMARLLIAYYGADNVLQEIAIGGGPMGRGKREAPELARWLLAHATYDEWREEIITLWPASAKERRAKLGGRLEAFERTRKSVVNKISAIATHVSLQLSGGEGGSSEHSEGSSSEHSEGSSSEHSEGGSSEHSEAESEDAGAGERYPKRKREATKQPANADLQEPKRPRPVRAAAAAAAGALAAEAAPAPGLGPRPAYTSWPLLRKVSGLCEPGDEPHCDCPCGRGCCAIGALDAETMCYQRGWPLAPHSEAIERRDAGALGQGVFATRDIDGGEAVAQYDGPRMASLSHPYAFELQPGWVVVGAPCSIASYFNSTRPGPRSKQPKGNLRVELRGNVVRFVATEKIKKDEQLLWWYGPEYWDSREEELVLKAMLEGERKPGTALFAELAQHVACGCK